MKVSLSNINAFLYTPSKYFDIPDFQRPYSWDRGNIETFLDDLEQTCKGTKPHFFGSIVYLVSGKESTIIDGQQRATTALLMIMAIYHLTKEDPHRSSMPPDEILESFLVNKFGNEPNRIKLRTVTTDDRIFSSLLNTNQYVDDIRGEDKDSRLYAAYKIFTDYFKDKMALDNYINALERFEIVDICLEHSDDNPQRIFESINSTGKPLSDGDKIRNFALMLNNNKIRKVVYEDYWMRIEQVLTDINQDYITEFFKHYLTSKLQVGVKLSDVYPKFKALFTDFICDSENLERFREFYGRIVDGLESFAFLKFNRDESKEFENFKRWAFRLNYLKIETPFPFLMSVLARWKSHEISTDDVNDVFQITESYLARRIVCNMTTQGLDKVFSSLDKEIWTLKEENPNSSYADIYSTLLLEKPGQLRFPQRRDLDTMVPSNPIYTQKNSYLLFILSSVDDNAQSSESIQLHLIASGDSYLTVEHVMPQTLNDDWKSKLGDDWEELHTQYLHTLPNLTLTGYNPKYSNKSFLEKKSMENGFDQSPLLINELIRKSENWNRQSFEERTRWWINQIDKIWPIPVPSFSRSSSGKVKVSLIQNGPSLNGTRVRSVTVLGETTPVATWVQALETILETLFKLEPSLSEKISTDDLLSANIRTDESGLRSPNQIEGTEFFVETQNYTDRKRTLVQRLAELVGLDDSDIVVEIDRVGNSSYI